MNTKNRKYELTDLTIIINTAAPSLEFSTWCEKVVLHRIRALKDFGDVNKGDFGGFVQSEKNLSQEGNCWIYDNSKVCLNSKVCDNAVIKYNVDILGNATICGDSKISGNIIVDPIKEIILDNVELYNQETLDKYLSDQLKEGAENKMSTDKKYELTDATMTIDTDGEGTKILHRIRALKDFSHIKKGCLGGWIESEKNLSQEGTCWVYDTSIVANEAEIHKDAIIKNDSCIYGHAVVSGYAVINNSCVSDHSFVFGHAHVLDGSSVAGNAIVSGNAQIRENSAVLGNAQVYGETLICESSCVQGRAKIHGKSKIYGAVIISNVVEVEDGEIYNDETMNKYLPVQLRKVVSESMEKVNPILSNNVEIKNMDDMVKDNYGSLNKLLETLYGQGPYTSYQVEYAMDMYKNRNTSSEDEESNNEDLVLIDVYVDIISSGTALMQLTADQYASSTIDGICNFALYKFTKNELDIDWSDIDRIEIKVRNSDTGELSNTGNTVSFNSKHSNN